MTDWQPISTAPLDGTWVLLGWCRWGKTKSISHLYVVAGFFAIDDRRPDLGGRWYYGAGDDLYVRDPMWWMPLLDVPDDAEVLP